MVFFNYATMQMAAKIVYYGPGLCGKTTNLHHIYTKTSPQSRGEMVSLETETDRTLFFDLLPIDVGVIGGFKTRLQLYTVPGQVFYNTTRKLVLKGVDGIVFVADSQTAMLEANVESLKNLRENLAEIGLSMDEIPMVLQLNKRDLPNIADIGTMLEALDPERRTEHVEAVAYLGQGVFETLKLISKLTLRTLRRRMTGEEPVRAPGSARSSQAHFRVKDDSARTMSGSTPAPDTSAIAATIAAEAIEEVAEAPEAERIEEIPASAEIDEATMASAEIDRHILASAPVAEPFVEQEEAVEVPAAEEPAPAEPEPVVEEVAAPEFNFNEAPEPEKTAPAEVKTVKVRSSVDVMAELEALRKRATQTTTRAPKRDILADLASLRPKRDLHRNVQLSVPSDLLPRTKSVRVTLSFEDGEEGVLETRENHVELGDTSDVQSLSVNLKIDLA